MSDLKQSLLARAGFERPWPAFLDSQEFYDFAQAYRHTPFADQALANKNYDELRFFVRDQIQAANARLRPLLLSLIAVAEKAEELLDAEGAINEKKVRTIDGVKVYPISEDFAKNAAYYALDQALAGLREGE